MVKIYTKDGKEEQFNIKDMENDLKAAGLPERLAQEVAERVENRVQDGWTTEKVKQEACVELRKLQEDVDRAYTSLKRSGSMVEYCVGEQRTLKKGEYAPNERPITESMVECTNVEA